MKTKLLSFCVISICLILTLSFQLQAQVVANFSSTPPTGCAPLSVSFSDLSTGSPTTWSWNFGNGNTSTSKNPSAIYSIPGTYTITLIASKPGSSSTKTKSITVYANPIADFTISTTTACVGTTITFTNSSTIGSGPITKWDWDFGDGNVLNNNTTGIATHSYTTSGTFPVSVIITDSHGCTNSIVKSVTVVASPVAAFTGTPLTSCTAPLTVNFTNTSTGSGLTYSWNFGDGTATSTSTNPSHTYTSTGSYTVKLVVTQGTCKDSIIKTNYVVIQGITANFSANVTSACVGSTISFTDLSAPISTSRVWDFGDGTPTSTAANPTHTFTIAGVYTISLTASAGGCTDSEIKVAYITINPKPVVAFTANNTQSCKAPFTVDFTDLSTNNAGWVWNFGDGTPTSSVQNPSHTYTASGTYSVTLIVTSANGCVSTLIKSNYIKISPPVAQFIATPREGCIPLLVNFTSTSSSSADPITNYTWDFGDGATTTTASITTNNTYTVTGTFTVKLVITTASGCKDSITKTNYIKAGIVPIANFTIVDSTVCYGDTAKYNQLSIGADSSFWKFGDGGVFTVAPLPGITPVDHLYTDTGKYTVTLIVYDKGCPDTLKQTDIVKILPPKPVFSFQLNCLNPYSVKFMDASIGADSLSWDFGDGTIVPDSLTPTHIYATRGVKTVTLTAFNSTASTPGCSFSVTRSFTIADAIAQYTSVQTGCYPFSVTFTNTSQDASSSLWTFGDGSPNSAVTNPPTHSYALKGLYNARLIITDVNGCKDTVTKVINVQGPVADFKADTTIGCAPLPIVFTDKSVSDSALVSWTWNFGNGSATQTVGTPSISYTYPLAGSYSVTMTVVDKNGCTKTATKLNYIKPTFPVPKFVIQPDSFACKNEVLTFNASTTNVATPATYSWNFGDGSTTSGVSPTHAYTTENTYTTTLTVTDKNGCTDSIKHFVLVQHPTVAFDTTVTSQSCGNEQLKFHDQSTGLGNPFTYSWNFGDGGIATDSAPNKTYTMPGTYSVSLTVTNSGGCSSTTTKNNYVVVPGPVGTFSFAPNSGCRPLTVTFTATSSNTDVYTWDFGDGFVISDTSSNTVTHTYTKDGNPTPILLLGDTLGDGSFCKLPAPSAGAISIVTVVLVDIDSSIISLDEEETVTIISTVSGFSGSPTYSWIPTNGLSCTDCQSPTITGDGSGTSTSYILTVTDAGGCVGGDSITIVQPVCFNDNVLIPNVFTPNDDLTNDLFDVRNLCKKSNYLIRIYNRWGTELFSSNDRKRSWDGRMPSGLEATEGVYYYIITLDDKSFTGFLHLIR